MAYELRELSGSLFKNDKKEKETHANAKGSALIGGVEYWVSAWTKKDKNGNPWQSLAFQVKEGKTAAPAPEPAKAKVGTFDDLNDCPF